MTGDVLMSRVKSCLSMFDWDRQANQAIYGEAKAILSEIRLEHNKEKRAIEATFKAQLKEASEAVQAGGAYPDDFAGFTPEQRSEEVAKLLDYKLYTKELTASELRELKDIFNLKAKDQDVIIEQTDFRAIEPELADIVAAVNWQIADYNKAEEEG